MHIFLNSNFKSTAFHNVKLPAILDEGSNAWPLQNAVTYAELQNMTNTLGRLQVAWQMWN